MLSYAFKNLKSLFTKQRLLAVLLVLNIVVSCLVICFSYGLYQNYNMIVEKGEEEEITEIDIRINSAEVSTNELFNMPTVEISPQMLSDFAKMLAPETKEAIECILITYYLESPLCYIRDDAARELEYTTDSAVSTPDFFIYSDDAEPAYSSVTVCFKPVGDKIVDAYILNDTFDDDRYNNGDKIVVIDTDLINSDMKSGVSDAIGSNYDFGYRKVPDDITSVIIAGERYEIVNRLDSVKGEINIRGGFTIPLGAIPEGSHIRVYSAQTQSGGQNYTEKTCFWLTFSDAVTGEQYNDVKKCIEEASGGLLHAQKLEFTPATEIYFYKTIMLIAVVIAVLAAINMAILYRYILEKRSGELAIFRICGCSKGKAIVSYLLECMIINVPLFALTQLIYHKLIMPRFSELFPNMAGAYSFKIYAAIFGIFIGASLIIMLIMIAFTIFRHSLVALKSAPKATSKFSIMKVFEVVQLAAVLSIMVLIVSVVVSRSELYRPFKQYFERKGYMAVGDNIELSAFKDTIGDCEYIASYFGFTSVGEIGSADYVTFYGIEYSDEFIDAYAPPLEVGIWLSDTDDTYEKDGYIPAVISSCDGRYKVGDILENDVYYPDEENDKMYLMASFKYKIIGVLKDKVNIASYTAHSFSRDELKYDFRDIYKVFNDEFEEMDYLLIRYSDEAACYNAGVKNLAETAGIQLGNAGGILTGTQFIFCEGMPEDEYEELGRKLERTFSSAVPLEVVRKHSLDHIYEQMYTLFPIAVCIFILTIISTVSISAIYTKRQLRNYAIFYICGARWRTCALKSLKNGAITCAVSAALSALILVIGKATLLKKTVISFGLWHFAVCAGVIVLYLALSMIMPLSIIGSAEPREVLKEE